jgi:hypothetical protein
MREEVVQEVSRRNAAAVMETLNRQDLVIQGLSQAVSNANAQLADLMRRVGALEQAEALRRAKSMGAGPTVRLG